MLFDPFGVPDYDHYVDEDKSQQLVTSISGSTEVAPSQQREVEHQVAERHLTQVADRELRAAISASEAAPIRVIDATGEIIMRQVFCRANVPTNLVQYNYNRSRIVLSGTGGNVCVSEQPPTPPFAIATPPMNAIVIGYATTFFCRTLNTQRDLWALSDADLWLSVQEEFYVS